MAVTDTVHFDSVYVVESLRPGDRTTGSNLVDNVLRPLTEKDDHLGVHRLSPRTRDELLRNLDEVAQECRRLGSSPILHIETHGDKGGIQVANNELLSWEELKGPLSQINEVSRLNLLVVMVACKGGNLVRVVEPTDRAPVWGIVGPAKDVFEDEIEGDFGAFYGELLASLDGTAALKKLNGCLTGAEWRYSFIPARFFFRYVYFNYLQELGTSEALAQREECIVSGLKSVGCAPTEDEERILRSWLASRLRDHESHFERIRRHFFMIDVFPDNDSRFPLTFAECQRDPAEDPD